MSYKDLQLLQKIKLYNQRQQGSNIGQQQYSGVNENLLSRASDKPLITDDKRNSDYKSVSQSQLNDLNKLKHNLIPLNATYDALQKIIDTQSQNGVLSFELVDKIDDIKHNNLPQEQKRIEIIKLYNNWAKNENNNHRLNIIQNIGSFSKERFQGESDKEYIFRMRQIAQNQPTTQDVIENQKLEEKTILRNNLLKIADIKQTELIMNDSRLNNPDIIHKINSIWNKILTDIKENYVQIDAKDFIDFALESMYNTKVKKEGKLSEKDIDINNVKYIADLELYVDKNVVYNFKTKQKINADVYNSDKEYSELKKLYPTITYLKSVLKSSKTSIITPKKKAISEEDFNDGEEGDDENDEAVPTGNPKKEKAVPKPKKVKEEVKEGKGLHRGFKLISSKSKKIIGRGIDNNKGIKQQEENDFVEFGKFIINADKLESNKLRVLYKKTYLNLKDIPTKTISDNLKDILLELIERQKFNERLFNMLDYKEKQLCILLLDKSNVKKILKIKFNDNQDDFKQKKERLEVLIGEINASNDSPLIKEEAKHLLIWLKNNNHISTQIYNRTIGELE